MVRPAVIAVSSTLLVASPVAAVADSQMVQSPLLERTFPSYFGNPQAVPPEDLAPPRPGAPGSPRRFRRGSRNHADQP